MKRRTPLAPLAILFLVLAAPLTAEVPVTVATERQVAFWSHEFYDGLTVTARQDADRNIRAEIRYAGHPVLASLHLRVADRYAIWSTQSLNGRITTLRYYDFAEDAFLERLLESHTVQSAALSALLLWEDALPTVGPDDLTMVRRQGCVAQPNGCTGWFQTCAGVNIRPACDAHDECYQCGAINDGLSREDCDNQFRQDILDLGGSTFCANVYYWGVRGLGWLFYQDPNARPPMGPDVYYLGIEINACPDGYKQLCTTYVL